MNRKQILAIAAIPAANAFVVAAPAMLVGRWEAAPSLTFLLPIALLSLAALLEAAAADPQRSLLLSDGRERDAAFRFNLIQGALLLAHFQSAAVVAARADFPPLEWVCVSGLALMAAGMALRLWAIRELGPAFTDLFSPAPRPRVTSGPFQYVRHPAELGLLQIAAGFALAIGAAPLLLISLPLLIAVSATRIRREEAAMRQG